MKKVGILGGMSWESTQLYYRRLNELAREALGGLHSAELLLWSFNFAEIEALQAKDEWQKAGELLAEAAAALQQAGADCVLIGTNTMHLVEAQVRERISVPLLHIADATAGALLKEGCDRPLLLGTKFTMEKDFYKGRLAANSISPVIPQESERQQINDIIYQELCLGQIKDASRDTYLEIINRCIAEEGANGVILGCTEIGLLIDAEACEVPVFDTTEIHCQAAIEFALS